MHCPPLLGRPSDWAGNPTPWRRPLEVCSSEPQPSPDWYPRRSPHSHGTPRHAETGHTDRRKGKWAGCVEGMSLFRDDFCVFQIISRIRLGDISHLVLTNQDIHWTPLKEGVVPTPACLSYIHSMFDWPLANQTSPIKMSETSIEFVPEVTFRICPFSFE